MTPRTRWARPWLAVPAAGALAVLVTLAACNRDEPEPVAPDEDRLRLERAYTNQRLDPFGKTAYRFRADKRGAYLILIYGNPTPLQITLRHPKRTCFFLGNGSCELVSGPDEAYDFEVVSDSADPVDFSVMVTHSDGRGRFEGDVSRPLELTSGGPHEGTVGVNESSYYSFRTRNSGTHTISLSGARSDLLWRLFDAADFDVILQECDYQRAAADESCQTLPLHSDTRYYVKVEERSGVPGPYRLAVYGP